MPNRIILLTLLIGSIAIYVTNYYPFIMDRFFIGIILLVNIIALFSFYTIRKENYKEIKGQHLRFSLIFIIGFCIVHFQAYIDFFLGFLDDSTNFIWINKQVVNKSIVLVSIGLISYLLGYSMFHNKSIKTHTIKKNKLIKYNWLFLKSLALGFFLLFLINIDRSFLDASTYTDRDVNQAHGIMALFFECTIFASIIIKSIEQSQINKKLSFKTYLLNFGLIFYLFALYLIIVMFSGDRGPIIYCSLSLIFGYLYISNNKYSFFKISTIIILLTAFITILGVFRGIKDDISISEKIVRSLYFTNIESNIYPKSILGTTKELATSIRTVHISVANVPKYFEYFNGLFLGQNISVLIPGLNSTINEYLDIPRQYFSSARFLTFLDMGQFATWGVGSSCVADIYLDFGLIGVIIIFILFGLFTRWMEIQTFIIRNSSIFIFTILILYFCFSIYISRSNLLVPFTKFSYTYIITLLSIIFRSR